MRPLLWLSFLFVSVLPVFAGEIVVYNQRWTGKHVRSSKENTSGKGYVLLDLENHRFTRISTGFAPYSSYQKIFRVETYSTAVFAEAGNSSEGVSLAVQGSIKSTQFSDTSERAVFLKGKNVLLSIGPSQKKQVPKAIAGLRRMTQSDAFSDRFEEESFSGFFNSSVTMDTNANSRTLEQEVELLTKSLEEAGYMRWGS